MGQTWSEKEGKRGGGRTANERVGGDDDNVGKDGDIVSTTFETVGGDEVILGATILGDDDIISKTIKRVAGDDDVISTAIETVGRDVGLVGTTVETVGEVDCRDAAVGRRRPRHSLQENISRRRPR